MKILFLGAGALGGYFGGRMTAGGADVTLLVREGRKAQLADGLRIQSPQGDAVIPVRTVTSDDSGSGPFDVIVLTCKAYGLDGALDAIAPFVEDGTVIIPLLNGLAHYEKIERRYPDTAVLGGIAHIPAEMTADGTIVHRGKLHRMTIGLRPGQEGERAKADAFVEAATAGGLQARVSETIEQDLWDKWVFLTSLAAGTCLMRADVGTICRTDHGIPTMKALIDECMAVAEAEGHRPDEKQEAFHADQLLNREGTFKASMLTDVQAGNPTEADHILGDMIARAERHGIPVPMLKAAMTHLQVYAALRDGSSQ